MVAGLLVGVVVLERKGGERMVKRKQRDGGPRDVIRGRGGGGVLTLSLLPLKLYLAQEREGDSLHLFYNSFLIGDSHYVISFLIRDSHYVISFLIGDSHYVQ